MVPLVVMKQLSKGEWTRTAREEDFLLVDTGLKKHKVTRIFIYQPHTIQPRRLGTMLL